VRQNVKKAGRRGLIVRNASFDDDFVRGVVDIYNETRVKQGRRFWHFAKSFDTVKSETGHALHRSIFIGAYFENKLVGFIKLLIARETAQIALIVCMDEYRDKKPTNALLAKAIEVCVERKLKFLTYAQFFYYKKRSSSLLEFKRRNGFEPRKFPRYYVPLTFVGKCALMLGLHHGIKAVIPETGLDVLRKLRGVLFRLREKGARPRKE
jgi:hypothetical protein